MSKDKIPVKKVKVTDTDDTQKLVEDFVKLSESSLNEVWLTPQEDEAWKEL